MALNFFKQRDIDEMDVNDIPEEFINYLETLDEAGKIGLLASRPDIAKVLGVSVEDSNQDTVNTTDDSSEIVQEDERNPKSSAVFEEEQDIRNSVNVEPDVDEPEEVNEEFIAIQNNYYEGKRLAEILKDNMEPLEALAIPDKTDKCFIHRVPFKEKQIRYTGKGATYGVVLKICPQCNRIYLEESGKEYIHEALTKRNIAHTFYSLETSNQYLRTVSMGMVTGKQQDYDADFVFGTIQTISKEETLKHYERDHWDLIIIDEAHHSSAASYKRIMDYFIPRLWLGMTATPDKRDDNLEGRNIYEIFNHQIAYEIRLQNAMEEDLLCPFHYFGITDLEIISDCGKSSEEKMENFRYLTSDTRVLNVMKQAEFFGYSGERVKGLIFCSRIDEAKELSVKFNEKGWRTIVLSGSDSESMREDAIERLTGDDSKDALDYIISVDIFSEGVDAPEINQVIMLRPTESPIVFIQQLGRGLRKAEGKEYVVVLDFIGNYRNNFMIPIALSGDRSYNKDNIRRYITEGGRVIPGASTIHFDEISRKRIFQAIDNANFSDIKLIRENYTNLKNKLGHIPALADFDKYGEMDVLRIFDNNSLGSYYKFLVKYEKEYKIRLSADEEKVIEFVSKKLASGKRIHELELLKRSLKYHHGLLGLLQESLSENYQQSMDENCAENIINMMTNHFPTNAAQKTYANCVFLEKEEDDYAVSKTFEAMLQSPDFYHILEELVDFGISRYHANYCNRYQNTDLVLYQKYTYEDVCRLLNWERNEVPLNIGGYKFDKKTKTFPIFINYDKQDDISDTTKYEDHFVGYNRLIAISKSGRTLDSEDVQNFLHAKERGIDVQLFVRKNKDDKISKEFYYLGRVNATGQVKEFVMPNTDKTAVEIEWVLDTPVREDIYEYIVNG